MNSHKHLTCLGELIIYSILMSVRRSELLNDILCLLSVVYTMQSPLDLSVLCGGISEVLLMVRVPWLVPSPAILKQQCGNKSRVEYVVRFEKGFL